MRSSTHGLAGAAALLLCAAAMPAAAQAPPRAALGPSAYVPTMADRLGVDDAVAAYRWGNENHDDKIKATAFAEGGVFTIVAGGQTVMRQVKRGDTMVNDAPPPPGPGGPGGSGGPGGPPPGGPPPGGAGQPPGEVWDVSLSDNWRWESPTRAVHYGYWLSIYQGTERLSTVGTPGHYEDVLEKVNGKWLFRERKVIVGQK